MAIAVTHSKCLSNINKIKKDGIKEFRTEHAERKELLETMLGKYNPGQCMSLYCLASALISIKSLRKALKQIVDARENKPKAFKLLIKESAAEEKVNLKLRR